MTSEQTSAATLYVQIALLVIQIPTLITLILYVIKTWEMAAASKRSAEIAEKTLQELRDTRDAEIAPYVIAYMDVPDSDRQLYLIIKNIGKSMATNIKITFDPPLQTPYPDMLARVLPKDGIPSMPPNYEIRTVVDSFHKYKISGPMIYNVELTYFGGISNNPRTASYVLDLWLHRGTILAVES